MRAIESNVHRTCSVGRPARGAQNPHQPHAREPGTPAATCPAPPRIEATTVRAPGSLLWVWLSSRWAGWRDALHLVRPETVIRWHRQGFRVFWTWKSRHGRTGRPPIASEIADLVRTMTLANPLWGAPRIHGELLKLGSPSRSAPLPGSCRVGRSRPLRLGARSSLITSPTSSRSISSSSRLRPSECSTCSWSSCIVAGRLRTSTSPIPQLPLDSATNCPGLSR